MSDDPMLITGANGNTIAYRYFGTGARLLTCLHSLALDGSWYEPLARALGPEYRLLAPDFRGHGQSAHGPAPVTLDHLTADIAAVWDVEGIERSVVLGISLGGAAAQAVTARLRNRVEAQILIATSGAYDGAAVTAATARAEGLRSPHGVEQAQDSTMRRWFGTAAEDSTDQLVRRAREQFLGSDGNTVAEYLLAMTRVGEFQTNAPPETLVVAGDGDQSVPPAVTERLATSIPGAKFALAHGGHLMAFDTPHELASVTRPYLDDLECWTR